MYGCVSESNVYVCVCLKDKVGCEWGFDVICPFSLVDSCYDKHCCLVATDPFPRCRPTPPLPLLSVQGKENTGLANLFTNTAGLSLMFTDYKRAINGHGRTHIHNSKHIHTYTHIRGCIFTIGHPHTGNAIHAHVTQKCIILTQTHMQKWAVHVFVYTYTHLCSHNYTKQWYVYNTAIALKADGQKQNADERAINVPEYTKVNMHVHAHTPTPTHTHSSTMHWYTHVCYNHKSGWTLKSEHNGSHTQC